MTSIPNYYWYDDGQFRGNLKLQRWQDYGEDPNIRGYICTYGGYVTNGSSPAQRIVDINETIAILTFMYKEGVIMKKIGVF